MTRKYKIVQKLIDVETLETITCDLCGRGSDKFPFFNYDWSNNSFDVEEIQIKYRTGSGCSEGGSGKAYDVDMCPECFKDRFLVWIAAESGKAIVPKDWEY